MKSLGIVPARLKSTRLENKPLQLIEGKTLLAHTLANLETSSLDDLVVLTDSEAVLSHALELGYRALLSPECSSGLERIAVMREHFEGYDRIVHVQCDEPNVSGGAIDILKGIEAPVGTLCCPIDDAAAKEPSNVKVVFNRAGEALYFSRAPIPFHREAGPQSYYKHIGLYSYAPSFLAEYAQMEKGRYESIEMLEQLTLLENGIPIKVAVIDEEPIGIDTAQDIEEFRVWLKTQAAQLVCARTRGDLDEINKI
jgi:3-deoxy-D-manno-octulosonate cytidylyltransferase